MHRQRSLPPPRHVKASAVPITPWMLMSPNWGKAYLPRSPLPLLHSLHASGQGGPAKVFLFFPRCSSRRNDGDGHRCRQHQPIAQASECNALLQTAPNFQRGLLCGTEQGGWGIWCKSCLFLTWLFCKDNCVKQMHGALVTFLFQLPWLLILKKPPEKGRELFSPCWEMSPWLIPAHTVQQCCWSPLQMWKLVEICLARSGRWSSVSRSSSPHWQNKSPHLYFGFM